MDRKCGNGALVGAYCLSFFTRVLDWMKPVTSKLLCIEQLFDEALLSLLPVLILDDMIQMIDAFQLTFI